MPTIKKIAKKLSWSPVYGNPPWKYEMEGNGVTAEVTKRPGRTSWDWEIHDPVTWGIIEGGEEDTEKKAKAKAVAALKQY